jgi:cytochrome P450
VSLRSREALPDVLSTLGGPSFLHDPYGLYAQLRDQSPVRLRTGELALARHADVTAGLREPRLGKPPPPRVRIDATRVLFRQFLMLDPPDHTRLRQVVAPAFTSSAISALRAATVARADELLPRGTTEVDLINDFAYPLPLAIIGDMLGVPAEDRPRIAGWSRVLTEALDGPQPTGLRGIARIVVSGARRRSHPVLAVRAARDIVAYARKRVAPAAGEPSSLLMELLTRSQRDNVMDADEAAATWVLVVIAGHETTANLIGNAVLALLHHPSELDRVRADATLVARAVEECLRYDTPVPFTARVARDDVRINEVAIERGQTVLLFMAAANRDPDVFVEPDRLDVTRAPNPHVGFGQGPHFCLGSVLARLETEVGLAALVPRLASGQRAEAYERRPTVAVRGLARLPVELTARVAA